MSVDEFKDLQRQTQLSGRELAELLKVTNISISRWRHGRQKLTGPVELAMKALASGWRP